MAARKVAIEFLPQESWEKGTWGKILKWALTIGRYIVIFTELVVILAFLSRFKLDRDLTDLGEKIRQQQAIIVSWSNFEKDFRFLNKRLQTIEEFRKSQIESGEILEELANLIPLDIVVSDFSVSNRQLSLSASAFSEGGLSSFLRNLKNSKNFKNITLTQISLNTEKEIGIKFQVKGEINLK
jgi:Tfp pilus assembly protein PilN